MYITSLLPAENLHGIRVHALASVELVVLEVGDESVLDVAGSAGLESLDLISRLASLLELGLDGLHVAYSARFSIVKLGWYGGEHRTSYP